MTGEDLKCHRTRLRMTQVEMAAYLQTPLGTYKRWEQGGARVPGAVAAALGLKLAENC